MKTCKRCGTEFEPRYNTSKYCEECSKLSRDVLNGKTFDCEKPQVCARCGKEFYYNRKRKYCSNECASDALRGKYSHRTYWHVCSICGERYINSSPTSDKCPACVTKARIEYARGTTEQLNAVPRKTEKRICAWCGKEYEAQIDRDPIFCSNKCNDAHHGKLKRAKKAGIV